jgi:hypothetical protein
VSREHNQRDRRAEPAAADPGGATRPLNLMPLKLVLLGLLVAFGLLCAGLHTLRAVHIQALAAADGLTPFPSPSTTDMTLYWINRPGHLLRIVAVPGLDIGLGVLSVGFTLFLALIAWVLRETVVPFIVVGVGVGYNVLATGAFIGHVAFPIDIAVDQDAGTLVAGRPIAKLCDIGAITIEARAGEARAGARSGAAYWLVGHLRSGGTVDLAPMQTRLAAEAVDREVAAALARVPCT